MTVRLQRYSGRISNPILLNFLPWQNLSITRSRSPVLSKSIGKLLTIEQRGSRYISFSRKSDGPGSFNQRTYTQENFKTNKTAQDDSQFATFINGNTIEFQQPRSKFRTLINFFALGTAAAVATFIGFVYYNVVHLNKTVKLPVLIQFDQRTIQNDYETLVLLESKQINVSLLENLIDYYLLERLSSDPYIQQNFKLPLKLEEFRFKKNKFKVVFDYKNLKVKIVKFSPNYNGGTKLPVKAEFFDKTFNLPSSAKGWRAVNPFGAPAPGSAEGKVHEANIDDTVKVYVDAEKRAREDPEKSGDVIVEAAIKIYSNDEGQGINEDANRISNATEKKNCEVRFKGLFNDEHRHYIKIVSCELVNENDVVHKLW